jgi:hypothetical protein
MARDEERARLRRTFIRVMLVQIITLFLLFVLQNTFGPG